MTTDPKPTPEPYDQEREIRKQTEMLVKINGKLGFIVFIIVAALALQFLAALLSY